MVQSTHLLKIVIQVVDNATKGIKMAGQEMQNTGNILDGMSRKFNMNTLSFIFGGLALQQLSKRTLGALSESYFKVTEYQTQLGKTVMGAQANFEFLKFSIFNALNQSELAQGIINAVAGLVQRVAEFINMHPEAGTLFVGLVTLAGIIGVVGGTIGLIAQVQFMLTLFKDMANLRFGGTIANLGSATGGGGGGGTGLVGAVGKAWGAMKGMVAGGLIIYGLFKTVQTLGAKEKSFGDILLAALSVGIGVGILSVSAGIISGIVVALALTLDKAAADQTRKEINDLRAQALSIETGGLAMAGMGVTGGKITQVPFEVKFPPLDITKMDMEDISDTFQQAVVNGMNQAADELEQQGWWERLLRYVNPFSQPEYVPSPYTE